jgi:hypothetical protein
MIVILLIALYFMDVYPLGKVPVGKAQEKYRSCRDCDGYSMSPTGTPVLNPFIWPYSGTRCVDDIYILGKDAGIDIGTTVGPLTHLNSPDHVILTN